MFFRKRSRRSNRIKKAVISAVTALSVIAGTACYAGMHTSTLAVGEAKADVREPQTSGLNGRIVILHSNDVHGAVDGYAKMATLKAQYEAAGAEVVLADSGGYTPEEAEYSDYRTIDALMMMFYTGYKVAGIADSELRDGYDEFRNAVSGPKFRLVCANGMKDDKSILTTGYLHETAKGIKIGFLGLGGTQDVSGVHFLSGDEMYTAASAEVEALKKEGADLVVALSQTGMDPGFGTASDLYEHVPDIDIILDGHSNVARTEGTKGDPVQCAGERFAYIGVVVIDGEGAIEDHYLVSTESLDADSDAAASAQKIIDRVGSLPSVGSEAVARAASIESDTVSGSEAAADSKSEPEEKADDEAEAGKEEAEAGKEEAKAAEKASDVKSEDKSEGEAEVEAKAGKEETKSAEKATDAKTEDKTEDKKEIKSEDNKTLDVNKAEADTDEVKSEEKEEESVKTTDGKYEVVKGDCLWNIAKKHLGDGTRWVEIYELNKGIISNPSLIYVGQQLVLPPG